VWWPGAGWGKGTNRNLTWLAEEQLPVMAPRLRSCSGFWRRSSAHDCPPGQGPAELVWVGRSAVAPLDGWSPWLRTSVAAGRLVSADELPRDTSRNPRYLELMVCARLLERKRRGRRRSQYTRLVMSAYSSGELTMLYQRLPALMIVAIVGIGLAACSPSPAAPPPVPVPAAASATTPPATTTMPAPTPTQIPAPAERTTRPKPLVKATTAAKKTSSTSSSAGCGQRAVTAGKFNPACKEYQGYLDPGTAGGRAPTSGEIQLQYLCETGQVPKSDC
jgi:hypothetical protein